MFKRTFTFFILSFFVLTFSYVFAHSGRTDANGGHKDNKNVSGLGNYHYHCGGHPAHLHNNGICPYSSTSGNKNSTKVKSTKSNTSKTTVNSNSNKSTNSNLNNTNNTKVENTKIEVEGISFISSFSTIEVGKEVKLIYNILPNNATDKTVKFTTDNPDILDIDSSNGVIKGKKVGITSVIATTSNGKSAKLVVSIIRYSDSVKISNIENKEMYVGEIIKLNCNVLPSDATKNISWTSSNNNIATVDLNGNVTGISKGDVIITAKDINGKNDSIKLTINNRKEKPKSIFDILLSFFTGKII